MRETYKTVPKLSRTVRSTKHSEATAHPAPGAGVGVGRRWSTATQSVAGQSTASHQSLHTAEHETRKISFVLQEQSQDTESLGSSKNSLAALHDEPARGARITQVGKFMLEC